MTLRERLNAKVKQDSAEGLKEEICKIFENADFKELRKVLTLYVGFDSSKKIRHTFSRGYSWEKFQLDYSEENLRDAVTLLEAEGLEVKFNDVTQAENAVGGDFSFEVTICYIPE